MREELSDLVEFTFLKAPIQVPPTKGVAYDGATPWGWWDAVPAEPRGFEYDGVEASLKVFREAHREQNFDGLLGFSQGLTAASSTIYIDIRRFTSIYVDIRRYTPMYVDILRCTSMYVDVRRCTSMYVDVRQCTSMYVDIRRYTSIYVDVRRCMPIYR